MRDRLRRWLAELREALSYVADPHGWEVRIRQAQAAKLNPRPAMFRSGDNVIYVHPALERVLRAKLGGSAGPYTSWSMVAGMRVYVSAYCVDQPPEGGWADVVVPERPSLRP